MHFFSFLYWSNDKSSFKSLSKTLGFYAKMDLDSPKNSKSPNPQWETNEKGSRIRIIPSFVNIHFVSLPLCTVLYVDIVPPHIICYTPISHAHASLSFCILVHVLSLHIISHMLIYISITCKLFHVLSLHIIPLNYLYIAPHAYLPIISLACVLIALIYIVSV